MTNYTITTNAAYDSRKVYFDAKPTIATLEALKALKMRWNPKKSCWYGFASEAELVNAIIEHGEGEDITGEPVEGATVYTDGYLGGGAVYGPKSNQNLYGSDLSAAIRADLKRAGIKGVTIRCKEYSGGQRITATVTITAGDIVDRQTYIDQYRITSGQHWIYTGTDTIYIDDYFAATASQQETIRAAAASYAYDRCTASGYDLNIYHLDNYNQFSAAGATKIAAVNRIISAYRYDESNDMVDYFNTNFYYDIKIKSAKK